MKKNVFLILFILIALIVTGSILFKKNKVSSALKGVEIGMPAPDFELKDLNGKIWRLKDLNGKIIILNFWASWCNECKEEKKSLQSYFNKNGSSDDLILLQFYIRIIPLQSQTWLKKQVIPSLSLLMTELYHLFME